MNSYYSSAISPVLYQEVEAIVTDILEHPERFNSRKSIRNQVVVLKAICVGLGSHQTAARITELISELKDYCKRGGEKPCGAAFVMQSLLALQHMVDSEEG